MSASLRSVDLRRLLHLPARRAHRRAAHLSSRRRARARTAGQPDRRARRDRPRRSHDHLRPGRRARRRCSRAAPNRGLLPLTPNVRELGAEYAVTTRRRRSRRRLRREHRRHRRRAIRIATAIGSGCRRDNQLLLRSAVRRRGAPAARAIHVRRARCRHASRAKPISLPAGTVPARCHRAADEMPRQREARLASSNAPAGFRLVRTQQPGRRRDADAEQLVYSGRPRERLDLHRAACAMRRTAAARIDYGARRAQHPFARCGRRRVTALGDVPPATVQAMARSVRAVAAR